MQVNHIDRHELKTLLADATTLETLDYGRQAVHILDYSGGEIIAIVNPLTGDAVCVHESSSFDREYGSVHDQARAQQ